MNHYRRGAYYEYLEAMWQLFILRQGAYQSSIRAMTFEIFHIYVDQKHLTLNVI